MIKYIFSSFLLFSIFILPAWAENSYILTYQKENRWVAQEDAAGLRAMLKEAKKQKIKHFLVQLPSTKRDITIERLIILRDILEKQLKHAITIEEKDSSSDKNKITVTFKK